MELAGGDRLGEDGLIKLVSDSLLLIVLLVSWLR